MINLMLGRPGAGKSYEAVVFQVMPALESGRKVITNLPLNLAYIRLAMPHLVDLIEIRERSTKKGAPVFSVLSDYGDEWRDEQNRGPLYVIDECHKALPRSGCEVSVEEWYAEHRHEGADVILITQSHGKLSRAVVDMAQVVIRCSNMRSIGKGLEKSYVRVVLDGVRGSEVHRTVRRYDSAKFQLYQSHTKSSGAVAEATPMDIKSLYMQWPFVGAAIFLGVAVVLAFKGYLNPFPKKAEPEPVAEVPAEVRYEVADPVPAPVISAPARAAPAPSIAEAVNPGSEYHPYRKYRLHIAGWVQGTREGQPKVEYLLSGSVNGQHQAYLYLRDLSGAGYDFVSVGPCLLQVRYKDYREDIVCDSPRVGLNPGANFASR